jgi:hypothetical protein
MPKMTIRIDQDLNNADWTKRSWDLPKGADQFLFSLRVHDRSFADKRKAIRAFLQHPVAAQMPESLRQELLNRNLLG